MSVRIAVSLRGQMRALASQGIFATDCYAQIRAILLQKLGPEHAALLAEPQHDAEGRNVDWYAEGHSEARPLRELPEAEAQALRAKAGHSGAFPLPDRRCPGPAGSFRIFAATGLTASP